MKKIISLVAVLCVFFTLLSTAAFAEEVTCPDCHGTDITFEGNRVKIEYNTGGHWSVVYNDYSCNNELCQRTFSIIQTIPGSWSVHSFGSYYVENIYHSGGYDHYTLRRKCTVCDCYERKSGKIPCNGGSGCCSIVPLSYDNVFPE